MDTSDRQRKPRGGWRFSLDYLETHEGTARLEGFSDAIFAIAATLLVIDIKVPPGLSDPARLWAALRSLWPNYLGYVLSFVYIGLYWTHHYHLFDHFKRTDHIFFKINILFLMMISFLPFPTGLLAEYLHGPDAMRQIAVLIYTGSLWVTASLFLAIWLYATHRRRLVDRNLDEAVIQRHNWRYGLAPIGYAGAFIVAFWHPYASLAITILVSLFYLIPFQTVRWERSIRR
jgi:uncharacterized membrane protein